MPRENNTEFVTRLMDYAQSGPLMQMFIIQALSTFAELVIESAEDGDLHKEMADNSFISPEAWLACAKELRCEMEQRINSPSQSTQY